MASQAATAQSERGASGGISRREFLYYIWGASIALVTLQGAGLLVWFLIPRFREGEFGGTFTVGLGDVPAVNAPPINFAARIMFPLGSLAMLPSGASMNHSQSLVSGLNPLPRLTIAVICSKDEPLLLCLTMSVPIGYCPLTRLWSSLM